MATIPLGLYLWRRVKELGTSSVMGLPGDFNLNFLDYIEDVPGLSWVGNANELNAAYAADGYARVKGVPGCLVTTHGVGELSAINGITGSMAESVPVIHVVGQTPRMLQDRHAMIHHCFGYKPDHQVYQKMSAPVRCASAELWELAKAPGLIDHALRQCVVQRLPVYIYIPLDLSDAPVPAHLLDTPLDLSPPVDKANEDAVVKAIVDALTVAKNPAVLVDAMVHMHGKAETRMLVDKLRLPTYASPMGKCIVDETLPYYVGVCNGKISAPGIYDAFMAADLVLGLGWMNCDTNTAFFSRPVAADKLIEVNRTNVVVKGRVYENVYMAPLLKHLAAAIKETALPAVPMPSMPAANGPPASLEQEHDDEELAAKEERITHAWLWQHIADFLQPGDVVLGETGTTSFGLSNMIFNKPITLLTQTYYGSIGWATPATLGADQALRELHEETGLPRRRTVLITGDGSMQLTIQEIGTMIHRGLQPIVMVLNNDGYTIERAIHGAHAKYNDITPYRWSKMLDLFGSARPDECFRLAKTRSELLAALQEPAMRQPQEVQVMEMRLSKLDVPWRLAGILKSRDAPSAAHLKDNKFSSF